MSGHRLPRDLFLAQNKAIPDPGTAGTINVNQDLSYVPLVSAAAETRTLAAPQQPDLRFLLEAKTATTTNTITVTVTGGFDEDGSTVFVFTNGGQFVEFISVEDGTDKRWRVVNSEGVAGMSKRVTYTSVAASAAHTNTTTEALFDKTYTVPANTLKAGSVIKIRYQGIATSTNSTDTLLVKLYLGGLTGTALLTGTATDVANDNIFAGEAMVVVRTIGASGTFVAVGTHTDVPAAAGTAVHDITEITASTAIDTTTTQVIGVGADWSVASASNSARLDIMVVEVL